MHIMCMHMAMAVMRIAFNIVSCFYLSQRRPVKSAKKLPPHPCRLAGVLRRIADDFPGDLFMKTCWILALLCASLPAFALGGGMERAVVSAMRKVPCGDTKSRPQHNQAPTDITTDDPEGDGPLDNAAVAAGQCMEYQLRSEKVRYVVRPRRAILLLLGSDVYIKLVEDELLLRTSEAPKDIHCDVVSMSLRSEEQEREARKEDRQPPVCLNESGLAVPCQEAPEPLP